MSIKTYQAGDVVRSPSYPDASDGIVLNCDDQNLLPVLWLTYQGGDKRAICVEASCDLEFVERPEWR